MEFKAVAAQSVQVACGEVCLCQIMYICTQEFLSGLGRPHHHILFACVHADMCYKFDTMDCVCVSRLHLSIRLHLEHLTMGSSPYLHERAEILSLPVQNCSACLDGKSAQLPCWHSSDLL